MPKTTIKIAIGHMIDKIGNDIFKIKSKPKLEIIKLKITKSNNHFYRKSLEQVPENIAHNKTIIRYKH